MSCFEQFVDTVLLFFRFFLNFRLYQHKTSIDSLLTIYIIIHLAYVHQVMLCIAYL